MDRHRVLDDAFIVSSNTLYVRSPSKVRVGLRRAPLLVQYLWDLLYHSMMLVVAIIRRKNVFFREFNNSFLLIYIIPSFFIPRVTLLVNHNLNNPSLLLNLLMYINSKAGVGFLVFELDESTLVGLWASVRSKLQFRLFPVMDKRKNGGRLTPPQIGVIHDQAGYKIPTANVVEQLGRTFGKSTVLVGCRDAQDVQQFIADGYNAMCTLEVTEFECYMNSISALVIRSDPSAYLNRHSGTIVDAASRGVVPIIFESNAQLNQVMEPVRVGEVFGDFLEGGLLRVPELRMQFDDYYIQRKKIVV